MKITFFARLSSLKLFNDQDQRRAVPEPVAPPIFWVRASGCHLRWAIAGRERHNEVICG